MSFLLLAGAAALAVALAAPAKTAATPAPEPARNVSVGIFTEISGAVDVVRARPADRPKKAARVGFAVHAGDEVKVGEGGRARIVVQAKCESVLVTGAKTVTVGAEGVTLAKDAKGKLEVSRLEPCLGASYIDLEPDSSLRAGAGRLRASEPAIVALEPADLKVCTQRPTFRWKASGDRFPGARVRIAVLEENGTERFAYIAGNTDASPFPEAAAPLEHGRTFKVRYELRGQDETVLAGVEAPFRVASAKEMEILARHRTASGGATLLGAMFADDFGCYVEALRDYRAAVGDDPPDNVSVRILWLSTVLDAGDGPRGP